MVLAFSNGAPASAMTVSTRTTRRSARYAAIRCTTAARSCAGNSLHTPASKLRRAAPIACSICSVEAVSTSAIVASVAGFSTASGAPSPGTYLPSMNGRRGSTSATMSPPRCRPTRSVTVPAYRGTPFGGSASAAGGREVLVVGRRPAATPLPAHRRERRDECAAGIRHAGAAFRPVEVRATGGRLHAGTLYVGVLDGVDVDRFTVGVRRPARCARRNRVAAVEARRVVGGHRRGITAAEGVDWLHASDREPLLVQPAEHRDHRADHRR